MKHIFLIIFFCNFLSNYAFGQSAQKYNVDFKTGAIKTIAFFEGIGYNVKLITSKSSISTSELNIAYERFRLKFSKAKNNATVYLQTIYKEYDESIITTSGKRLLDSLYQNIIITPDYVKNYTDRLLTYLEGNSTEVDFNYLISFQFYKDPFKEFTSGYVSKFNTKNHPKAKGADWTIKYPQSWRCLEGDRPNVIQKFVSEFGNGDVYVSLMVKDLPKDLEIKEKEINDVFFTLKGAKDLFITSEMKFESFKRIIIENLPAGEIVYSITASRLDYKLPMKIATYYFIYNKQLYILTQGLVGTEEEVISKNWKNIKPLFDLIANSIVINNKY